MDGGAGWWWCWVVVLGGGAGWWWWCERRCSLLQFDQGPPLGAWGPTTLKAGPVITWGAHCTDTLPGGKGRGGRGGLSL